MRSFAADRRVRSGRRARSGQVRSGSLSTAVGSPQGRPDRTLALEAQRPNRPARLRSPRKPPSQVTRPQGRGRTATFHGRSHAPRLRRATPARPRAKSYIGRRPRGRLPRHQRLGLRFARKAALASTRSWRGGRPHSLRLAPRTPLRTVVPICWSFVCSHRSGSIVWSAGEKLLRICCPDSPICASSPTTWVLPDGRRGRSRSLKSRPASSAVRAVWHGRLSYSALSTSHMNSPSPWVTRIT